MKDLLGREVKVGNYICYAKVFGVVSISIYKVIELYDNILLVEKVAEGDKFVQGGYPTFTIGNLPERIFILDGFSPELFNSNKE